MLKPYRYTPCDHETDTCQECCDHGDICTDERICLDCDKDMTEYLTARAEWALEE